MLSKLLLAVLSDLPHSSALVPSADEAVSNPSWNDFLISTVVVVSGFQNFVLLAGGDLENGGHLFSSDKDELTVLREACNVDIISKIDLADEAASLAVVD